MDLIPLPPVFPALGLQSPPHLTSHIASLPPGKHLHTSIADTEKYITLHSLAREGASRISFWEVLEVLDGSGGSVDAEARSGGSGRFGRFWRFWGGSGEVLEVPVG